MRNVDAAYPLKPLVIVVSGPGGVGKGTVVAELVAEHPELWLSKSWTTRSQRPSEADDAYVYVSVEDFQKRVDDDGFLEHAEFLGNFYGTPRPKVAPDTESGLVRDIVLEIDVQGARQVLEACPDALLIFLRAPSLLEQEARLRGRGDPPEKVVQRLAKAREEADAGLELGAYQIINDQISETVREMWQAILKAKAIRG